MAMRSAWRVGVLLSALLCHVAGSTQSCGGDLSPATKSKYEFREELREKLKVLRTQRDDGIVSEAEYRDRKDKLRELGKTGSGSGIETPPLRHRKSGRPKKDKHVEIPQNFQKVTWEMVKHSFEVDSIEDPVTGCHMDKHKFGSIFKEMLQDLTGEGGYEDSFMDFYFERDVITTTLLKFINEERKADWVEWAEEAGVQPTMEEIKAGETKVEKAARERREDNKCP